jgi:hypothetical protein
MPLTAKHPPVYSGPEQQANINVQRPLHVHPVGAHSSDARHVREHLAVAKVGPKAVARLSAVVDQVLCKLSLQGDRCFGEGALPTCYVVCLVVMFCVSQVARAVGCRVLCCCCTAARPPKQSIATPGAAVLHRLC